MATTTKDYEGNGSKGIDGQEVLTFDFPYLKIEDINDNLLKKYLDLNSNFSY